MFTIWIGKWEQLQICLINYNNKIYILSKMVKSTRLKILRISSVPFVTEIKKIII